MQFNLYHWLFDSADVAGSTLPGGIETFHYFWPWLIFSCAGLLIAFYYAVEGRKRFFKTRVLAKYMLDKYLGWFAVICFVALPLIFGRMQLSASFFAWRFWRYLWLIALLYWVATWVNYLLRKYPRERANLLAWENRQQYVRKSSKRKAKAGSR